MQRSSSTRGPAARPGPRGEAEKDQPPKSISGFFPIEGISGHCFVTQIGTVTLDLSDVHGLPVQIQLHDVFYHPGGFLNLVAVGDLNRSSWNVRYDVDFPHMVHSNDNTTIELPKTHQGLFALRRIMSPRGTASINGHSLSAAPAMTRTSLTKAELLHLRLHASPKKLAQFARLYPDIGSGITMRDLNALHSCRFCSDANVIRSRYPPQSSTTYASNADVWTMDMFDMTHESVTGKRYVFLFVMLHSRLCIEVCTESKSDALMAFRKAISYAGFHPRALRSDNAGEFESEAFVTFCD